uniref:AIG1-type G domain-containing protein n=1 Tax=Periophthalmus magnuspinnatus TaxID=409849 RepID=A0A3B4A131_9GOBI
HQTIKPSPASRKGLRIQPSGPDRWTNQTPDSQINKSKLKKFIFGKRDPKFLNKTILLVGETGSGKSTLMVNALLNFVTGVKFEDKVWFKVIPNERDQHQSESQTTEGKIVTVSRTIIDTPGYGHVKRMNGVFSDCIVTQKLQELCPLHTVDIVDLVLTASQNRLDERITYIFDSVRSIFDKNMRKNIVAMITHSDGREPKPLLQVLENVNIKYANDEDNEPVYFLNLKVREECKQWWFNKALSCKKCEETCHKECTWTFRLSWCEVMEGGKCTVCFERYPASDYVCDGWRYATRNGKVEVTTEAMKRKDKTDANAKTVRGSTKGTGKTSKRQKQVSGRCI